MRKISGSGFRQHAGELQHRRGKVRLVQGSPSHAYWFTVRGGFDDTGHGSGRKTRVRRLGHPQRAGCGEGVRGISAKT